MPRRAATVRTSVLERCINVAEIEALARRRMPRASFDYYAGGAEDERTLAANRSGFDRYVFLPRVLVNVGRIRMATQALGAPVSMPILLAPAAYHRLATPKGETATARAAGVAGSLMVASTLSTCTLEEIAAAASGPLWFQLDVFRDRSLTWEAAGWLRGLTRLPIVLKGILRPDDAARAIDAGADGVWVSNHGGRQLDSEQSTILALPAVVQAVAGRAEVYVDGGFRRGTDVLKALALGARAVFVGRPYLWGLAAGGEKGAARVLALLRDELETAMAVAGAADAAHVDPSLVVRTLD